jgi:hypothetical protein
VIGPQARKPDTQPSTLLTVWGRKIPKEDVPLSQAALDRRAGTVPVVPVVSARELLPYVLFGGILLMLLVYFVGAEEGATSLIGGQSVHELLHDARHLLGFPCH